MSMESKPLTCPGLVLLLLLATAMPLPMAAGGSCREAQLCCNGRDSSCVVQKAPVNAIIEDLSDKPCYCDHACLKLGDCCEDFKDHCGELSEQEPSIETPPTSTFSGIKILG
ncbi:GL18318 [Drosophila persimilis]|uniref:GL18318 n=1 Tax=Drosophila persimilis TaxID=7234 RepID=B4H4T6_DROPE|nr:GL18318 [Drosophila persimilis]